MRTQWDTRYVVYVLILKKYKIYFFLYIIISIYISYVSSTIDSAIDGSTLKKRKLPINATSSSQNGTIYEIAERVKQRRRPAAQIEVRQEITLSDSSSSKQHQ